MSALLKHIEALNAKTQAWIDEDPGNRWAGMMTTDLDHWAECGVYTPEQFDRLMDEECYSDVYKDRYGVRPRNISSMSDEELRNALERL